MKILIAEDDIVSRRVLEGALRRQGHDVVVKTDGAAAWSALQKDASIDLALFDWMMPGFDGLELCRRIRARPKLAGLYIILVTARTSKDDLIAGLNAGADDYLTKPFAHDELRARLQVGQRIIDLQKRLAERVEQLQDTINQIQQLQGLLPICSYCKKIRDDGNYWQQVETYVAARTEARFSHSICPSCWDKEIEPQLTEAGVLTINDESGTYHGL